MNKALAAGIGIGIVLIALGVLFMTDQSGENGIVINEELDLGSDSKEGQNFEVKITEGLEVSAP